MGPKSYVALRRKSNGAADARRSQCGAMRSLLASLLVAGCLAGCASSEDWSKPGATKEQIGRDTADCLAQAQIVRSGPQGPRTTIQQDQYQNCMTSRGYKTGPSN